MLPPLLSSCTQSPVPASHRFSTIVHVALSDWKLDTHSAGQTGFTVDLPVPEIDAAVIEGGGVSVYYLFDGAPRWEPLPLVLNGVIYHAYHSKGHLSLRIFAANGGRLRVQLPPEVIGFKARIVVF